MSSESLTKNNQLLSIVLPTYGVESYLQACLESILEVPCLLEILVVIDASPDASIEIARQFERQDSRVRVLENEKNKGLGASRNVGFRAAKGKYVLFADSDDLVVPDALARMVNSLEESGSDFATAPADEFGRTKSRVRYWTTTAPIFREGIQKSNIEAHPELIADHTAWTKVYRSSFWRSEKIEWAEGVKCEDVYASTQGYARAKNIDVIPEVSYLYRRRPGSITTNLTASRTLGDWARQTLLALAQLEDASEAKQYMVAKLLQTEIPSRVDVAAADLETEDALSLELCIAETVQRATLETIRETRPHVLEKLVASSWQTPSLKKQVERVSEILSQGDLKLAVQKDKEALAAQGGTPVVESSQPVLSVVMPTFNVSYWVEEAIRSILNQKFDDLELIIVDDASTDGTWERVQKWAARDSRVRAVRNPGHGGAQARNFGVASAEGKFLAFADGDDLIPAGAYDRMISKLQESGSQMLVGDFQKFWPSSTWRNSEAFGLSSEKTSTRLGLHPKLIGNRTCWNRLFRMDFWRENSIHFPSTPRANDILPMTLAMREADSIDVVPEVVYHYRARSGNGSMTAKLASSASVVGYFRQESLCAALIGSNAPAELSKSYWHTALGVDGWGNLSTYFKGQRDMLHFNDAEQVASGVRDLWRRAPQSVRRALGPHKSLTYELVSTSKVEAAAKLWAAGQASSLMREDAPGVLRAISVLERRDEFKDEIIQIYRGSVLRPLFDDKSDWNKETVEEIIQLSQELSSDIKLRECVVPETREGRMVEAILAGRESLIWRESRGQHVDAEVRLVVTSPAENELDIHVESPHLEFIHCLEIVKKMQKGESPLHFPLFLENAHARISPSLFEELREASWKFRAVVYDQLGTRRAPIEVSFELPELKKSATRVNQDELKILLGGTDRVRRAVEWRMAKLKRIASRGSKK